ncbi:MULTISPECIES: LysE family translocator [unclassified Leisingera]|uniref:LysE family translocator n=1 Tax=unclassified Leisingera TaxID=2614906 RepID=UPI0003079B94|nr:MULTISPECIES: LysE family translocator [unclassified Leisingera]KIC24621.1 threonine transporter RhtB [Leisingera sp. ANG-S3]KIC31724.1 threonine transporter RhtB [Leisingera sp. ANG-S5]KIC55523.1 threonine transporter RhtB [Leisingera sp. ANG-S]KID09255.1 threonine transporter RhtB [Leisingera sp. ANG1]
MIDPVTLLAFIPAALALNLTPGADMMFCLGQGLRSGRAAAVAASAGISAGSMVHVALAGLGLGAVVSAMPGLFDVIRWIGVGYLLYLAWGALRCGAVQADAPSVPARQAFRSGFLVNLTNPKVILFVLAFVPQFVRPEAGPVLAQFLVFGLILAAGGFVINGLVGIFAGQAGRQLTGSPVFARWLGRISAGIFTGLAVRLAIMERA